jgi:four helix bundle protein
MQDHTKLSVWHRARSLAVAVHEVSQSFAGGSAPGLRTQLLRAAMSISANVAEGAARESRLDFARFVSIAAASASEVEHHLTVAGDFGLIEVGVQTRLVAKVVEVRRMLFGLQRALLAREAEERARWKAH